MNFMQTESNSSIKLYLVHCGFYDNQICSGVFESHVNYFVVAKNFDEARLNIKTHPEFKEKRMHIDGLQEIQAVNGYELSFISNPTLNGGDIITSFKHRDLAPKPTLESVHRDG